MASTSGTSAEHQRSLSFAIETIDYKTSFVFHKVTSRFCSRSSFPTLDLRLAAHTKDALFQVALHVKDLFKVEVEGVNSPSLEFIANSRKKSWPPFYPSSIKDNESHIMISLGSEVFAPLCSKVLLDSRHGRNLQRYGMSMPELQVGHIGVGSVDTWHGTPDARIRGVEVVQRVDSGEEWGDPEDDSEDEGSGSTAGEGEMMTLESNLAEAVGTCVVASFTAKARYPERKALVPTVLIDDKEFRVILYDCEKDVLLISISKAVAPRGKLSRSAMALLWLVINHRLFLQELPTTANKYKSGIKSHLEEEGTLDSFTSLRFNTLDWISKQTLKVESSEYPVIYEPPPSKRRKKSDTRKPE